MEINLSTETIKTTYNALRDARHNLNRQFSSKKMNPNKKEIIEHQLAEVEDALAVFEELMDNI